MSAPALETVGGPPAERYADAVRARRAELRAIRASLLGGHRAELRGCLAACRLTASAELAAALTGLDRELRHHADRAGGRGRAGLPAQVDAAVGRFVDQVGGRWAAAVVPALRRVVAVRCPSLSAAWPSAGPGDGIGAVLRGRPVVALPAPDPPQGAVRALLAGATEGTWRLALLPAAVLPAVGLPALAGRSALPLALALGLTLLAAGLQARRVAADRARLRRWGGEVVEAVRRTLETELARRLLEVERLAAVELDDLLARRRAEVDAELLALAPEPAGAGVDG
jgi:hypothetical protein